MPSYNVPIKNEKKLKKKGIQLTNPSFVQKNYQKEEKIEKEKKD